MQKEYIINKGSSITVNITGGKVDSYREKDETQCTVRVYDQDKIGVAGALGEADFKQLEEQAIKKLEDGISYPSTLSNMGKKSIKKDNPIVAKTKILGVAKRIALKLAKACPRFIVNGKVKITNSSGSYKNSAGSDLEFSNNSFSVTLQLKDKDSSNIADAFFRLYPKAFGSVTENKFINDVKVLHDAFFGEKITLPNGKYPVIISTYDVFGNVLKDFVAESYVSGGSLFNEKLGKKIFNENLTVAVDRNPKTNRSTSFYDAEGEIASDYRAKIIDKGVFKSVFTTKNTAKIFNLPISKTSSASYDGVPTIGVAGLYVKSTASNLSELLGSEKAIYIAITSGGDITTEGVIGMPVQLAFLVQNGKIMARVTDFSASGNVKDMLGSDFVGVSAKDIFDAPEDEVLVTKMNIINN